MTLSSAYFKQYNEYLILKNYSSGTISIYLDTLRIFFDYCKEYCDASIDYQEYARRYILDLQSRGLSWSTINIQYSSLKLFCVKIKRDKWDMDHLPRPKNSKPLPRILSQQEVVRLIETPSNLKHRVIIAFIYATGLRISEVLNIKLSDIDSDRLELFIHQGKGKKDRIVRIPKKLLDLLRVYYKKYKPKKYLFEGVIEAQRYSSASVRKILLKARSRAKITKPVSPHTLRHCYATHHLENGTDLVYLKEQLGHSKLMTTAKYIHLCHKQQRHINHPFEKLTINIHQTIT
jgi:integrase/recombinase XerD